MKPRPAPVMGVSPLDVEDDEADYQRYFGRAAASSISSAAAAAAAVYDDDGDVSTAGSLFKKPGRRPAASTYLMEEDDDDAPPKPRVNKRPTLAAANAANEDGGADVLIDREAEKLFAGYQLMMPLQRPARVSRVRPVPLRVQEAAYTILADGADDIDGDAKAALEALVKRPDDMTVRDPQVRLSACVDTGPCRIALREVVPISHYLLACALSLGFTVQPTPKSKMGPFMYGDAKNPFPVTVRPYRGDGGASGRTVHEKPRHQSFGCFDAVAAALEADHDDATVMQFRAYIYALGPLSPYEACDPEWIQTTLKSFQDILSGKLVVLRPIKTAQ